MIPLTANSAPWSNMPIRMWPATRIRNAATGKATVRQPRVSLAAAAASQVLMNRRISTSGADDGANGREQGERGQDVCDLCEADGAEGTGKSSLRVNSATGEVQHQGGHEPNAQR